MTYVKRNPLRLLGQGLFTQVLNYENLVQPFGKRRFLVNDCGRERLVAMHGCNYPIHRHTSVRHELGAPHMLHVRVPNPILNSATAYKPALTDLSLEFLRPYLRQRHSWNDEKITDGINSYIAFVGHFAGKPEAKADVPSTEVDTVWHAHILHTREYRAFCDQQLGFFLHHAPCLDHADCSGDGGGCSGGGGWE